MEQTSTNNPRITVRVVDWQSEHRTRNEWVDCPWCEGEHAVEFVEVEGRWFGWCNGSRRMVEADVAG